MSKLSGMVCAIAVLALAVVGSSMVSAQEDRQPGGRGQRMTREEFMARMAERQRESLGATEEEWQVLGPKVEAVQTLSRQLSGGGFRRMGGRRGGDDQQPAENQTEIEKATAALRETLDNEGATAADIKAKLTALRAAREKARQELAKAQDELRELVTQRQEALLVLQGLLD